MAESKLRESFVLGVFLCLGLVVLGWFISEAAYEVKGADRVIEVKGLAERSVTADVAVWPITFRTASDDLNALYSEIDAKVSTIRQFLLAEGFSESEITVSNPDIVDRETQEYYDADRGKFRFYGNATITVYTSNVGAVVVSSKKTGELVKKGIVVSSYGATYSFNGLNDIKPSMIEEATKNAREAGEKFAQDSHSSLGKIKSARQGQFTIRDRDDNTPQIKQVRVVTTLEYFLSD